MWLIDSFHLKLLGIRTTPAARRVSSYNKETVSSLAKKTSKSPRSSISTPSGPSVSPKKVATYVNVASVERRPSQSRDIKKSSEVKGSTSRDRPAIVKRHKSNAGRHQKRAKVKLSSN